MLIRQSAFVLAAAVLMFAPSGCGDAASNHDAAAEQMIGTINEVADILATVQDENSANAAAGRLEAVAPRVRAEMERAEQLYDTLTEDQRRQLEEKYSPQLTEATGRLLEQLFRVQMQPDLMTPALRQAMDDLEMTEPSQ